jgi:cytidylate kinase
MAQQGGVGDRPIFVVVMGVSGSGKTTVGELLALRLGVPFADADDLHPASNVAKMAAGHPLKDDDRSSDGLLGTQALVPRGDPARGTSNALRLP